MCPRVHVTDQRLGDPQSGFILVPVLLGVALLAAIALAVSATFRLEVKARAELQRAAEARVLADGIARVVALRLTDRSWLARWRDRGDTPAVCAEGGAQATVSIIDAGGLVDLNAAPRALLERLVATVAPARAVTIAGAIIDFRDGDNEPVPNGAETEAYRVAGVPHDPKNAAFETVAELDQVLGITPDIFARLRAVVTVHGRQPRLDLAVAPAELLSLLAGPGAAMADAGEIREMIGRDPQLLPVEFHTRAQGRTFVVRVAAVRRQGGRFVREAVIDLTPQTRLGYAMREWASPASLLPQHPWLLMTEALAPCRYLLQLPLRH